ncbi:hypothetical protein QWY31_03510 [Cytophagales bacterium LB-30]|uniref:Outer membrane protein beta-barrel domain-containing protein n=1 Tax=Shiella aurantiaca TaxID=3058365 RepID=A0ABT8F2A9_9BACT|nr:hypothetical protein [Shiella aurantiaca]MDN4164552.1 hypothetical protein [Shiella aurantiaca]
MNKKTLSMLVGVLCLSQLTLAQTDSTSRTPQNKDFMVELNFNPFGGQGVFNIDNLRTKYWISDKVALRLGFQFDYNSNELTDADYQGDSRDRSSYSEQSLLLGINPGIEYRFRQNNRVSPYVGVELAYRKKSSSANYTDYIPYYDVSQDRYSYELVDYTVEGVWREFYSEFNGDFYYSRVRYDQERGFTSYGANLLFGTDVFLWKGLYMGFEFGLGYHLMKYAQIEVVVDNRELAPDSFFEDEEFSYPSSKSGEFGLYYNNSIRLGVLF